MSQKSVTSSRLDKLNATYQKHLDEKLDIQNKIDRIRKEINSKEQEIVAVQQKWIREKSDDANNYNNVDDDDDDENNKKTKAKSAPAPRGTVKVINETVEQLQAELKTLIQKSKFVGKKIDDLELEMLDVATKSEANSK